MSRRTSVLAVATLWLAATPPAHAGTAVISQTIPITQDLGDGSPFSIFAQPFDTSLGNLLSVSVEFKGTYKPELIATHYINAPPLPNSVTLTTEVIAFARHSSSPTTRTNLPVTQTVTMSSPDGNTGTAIGVITAADLTLSFSDVAAFKAGVGEPLVEYGFRTSVAAGLNGNAAASDLTSFSGEAIIGYTYQVAPRIQAQIAPQVINVRGQGFLPPTQCPENIQIFYSVNSNPIRTGNPSATNNNGTFFLPLDVNLICDATIPPNPAEQVTFNAQDYPSCLGASMTLVPASVTCP